MEFRATSGYSVSLKHDLYVKQRCDTCETTGVTAIIVISTSLYFLDPFSYWLVQNWKKPLHTDEG